MRSKYLFLFFFQVIVMAFFIIPFVKGTIDVPISKNEVDIDGVVNNSEWSDAHHIRLNSFDNGYFDFYLKYDLHMEELLFGFILDDSNYDEIDRVGFFFDTLNDGGTNTNVDDFAIVIFRQTTNNYDFYPYPIDSIYIEGNGSGFFQGDSYYDPSTLSAPFGWFFLNRGEINPGIDIDKGGAYGDSWQGEFSMGLPLIYLQSDFGFEIGFGLEYWDYNYNGDFVEARWYPSWITDAPSTWETLYMQYSAIPLSVSLASPISENYIEEYTSLVARVTSNGYPVSNATADFYVDGNFIGFNYTDIDGYAYYNYYPLEGSHSWYVYSYKKGYIDNYSPTQILLFSDPIPRLSISDVYPSNSLTLYELPTILQATVTSDGSVVSGAVVSFFVDDAYVGSAESDKDGSVHLEYIPSVGTHTWYVNVEKTNYKGYISSIQRFTFNKLNPSLLISEMSPNGAVVDESIVSLRARVTSNGDPVGNANVELYIDDEYLVSAYSDNLGYVEFMATIDEGIHTWYVEAYKEKYIEASSSPVKFSYEIKKYYLKIYSDVLIPGEGYYETGETVSLSAYDVVDNFFIIKKFESWLIDGTEDSNNILRLKMDSDKTITVNWRTDYSRLYLIGLAGLGVLGVGVYFNQINKKKKKVLKDKILHESELHSLKDRLTSKINLKNEKSPINLLEEVTDRVSVEEAKKILEGIVSENSIKGWYIGRHHYITEKTLKNNLFHRISENSKKHESFDISEYSKSNNLDSGIVSETIRSLLEQGILSGHISKDKKFIPDTVLKEKIEEYFR